MAFRCQSCNKFCSTEEPEDGQDTSLEYDGNHVHGDTYLTLNSCCCNEEVATAHLDLELDGVSGDHKRKPSDKEVTAQINAAVGDPAKPPIAEDRHDADPVIEGAEAEDCDCDDTDIEVIIDNDGTVDSAGSFKKPSYNVTVTAHLHCNECGWDGPEFNVTASILKSEFEAAN